MSQTIEPTLEIQRLEINEWERLRKIRLAALEDAPEAFGSTFAKASTWAKENWIQQINRLPTFLAVHHGLDSGIVRCAPHPEKEGVADLFSLWVAPHARGKKVGEALIETVIDWGRSEGYAQLLLDVGDHNNFAIALYQRKGFRATGITSSFPSPRQHMQEYEMAINL